MTFDVYFPLGSTPLYLNRHVVDSRRSGDVNFKNLISIGLDSFLIMRSGESLESTVLK